jgi:ATP-dependent Clp protease ATP-binding subunit ClpB
MQAERANATATTKPWPKYATANCKRSHAMLKAAEEKLEKLPEENRFTNRQVTSNDIADVVSRWTGIPVAKMMQSEKESSSTSKTKSAQSAHRAEGSRRSRSRRGAPQPRRPAATPTAPSALSSSSALPAWAKPNWPKPWPMCSSTTKKPSPALT